MNVMMDKEDDVAAAETAAALQEPLVISNNEDTLLGGGGGGGHDNHDEEEQQQNLQFHVIDEVVRGEQQPHQYRDAPFAVLFLIHLVVIFYFAVAWGIPAIFDSGDSYNNNDNDTSSFEGLSVSGVLGLCVLCMLASLAIISGAMIFMIKFAEQLIQFSLIFSVILSLVFAVSFATQGLIVMSILYFILFLWGVCYAYFAWRRIPFARSNLVTATAAIKANMGVVAVAFGMLAVFAVWSVLWVLSFAGVYMHNVECQNGECEEKSITGLVGVFYMLSFYWTVQVITVS
jgi:hypothetical protein